MKKLTHLMLFMSLFLGSINIANGQKPMIRTRQKSVYLAGPGMMKQSIKPRTVHKKQGVKAAILRHIPGTVTRQKHRDKTRTSKMGAQFRRLEQQQSRETDPRRRAVIEKRMSDVGTRGTTLQQKIRDNAYTSKWQQAEGRIKNAVTPFTKKSFWVGKKQAAPTIQQVKEVNPTQKLWYRALPAPLKRTTKTYAQEQHAQAAMEPYKKQLSLRQDQLVRTNKLIQQLETDGAKQAATGMKTVRGKLIYTTGQTEKAMKRAGQEARKTPVGYKERLGHTKAWVGGKSKAIPGIGTIRKQMPKKQTIGSLFKKVTRKKTQPELVLSRPTGLRQKQTQPIAEKYPSYGKALQQAQDTENRAISAGKSGNEAEYKRLMIEVARIKDTAMQKVQNQIIADEKRAQRPQVPSRANRPALSAK